MARRKKAAWRKVISAKSAGIAAVFVVMGISLSVRWSGAGKHLTGIEEPFEMEVLNGTGEPGLARMITRQLRMAGVDVVLEGNASRFDFKESLLIDNRNNPALMKKLARRFGCRRVLKQQRNYSEVDVTLIIGWDRDRLKIGEER
ncbi:MAG: LytR C-terminal domain-containing protein [Candidatus Krumholzibacteriota bacterium]|nr:LytR C-terminal domain-containing protein [Candidatus Krumholzibacteriota bacterium]